jgi:hypothetical protein
MNAALTALLILACVLFAALLGSLARRLLPAAHLNNDTKDVVRISAGLVATMAAILLGMLIAEAKGAFDNDRNELTRVAAQFMFLDSILKHYGTDAEGARNQVRITVQRAVGNLWPDHARPTDQANMPGTAALYRAIEELKPDGDLQRSLKSQAAAVAAQIEQTRWLLLEQSDSPVSPVILGVLTCWLGVVFFSFGLFAPTHGTATGALVIAALSVSVAVFLILELSQPFSGFIQIPNEPMLNALRQMGG